MARTLKHKELSGTRLASGHGGWIYCESCGETIGYLCYVTYNRFRLSYECRCGGHGSMELVFEEDAAPEISDSKLTTIKNRLCCPKDNAPLFTILHKKLSSCRYEVTCEKCGTKYAEEKSL